MTAELIGSFSLGDAIPGLAGTLSTVGAGLTAIVDAVNEVTGLLTALQVAINALASEIDSVSSDLIAGPFGQIQDQLTAISGALDTLEGIVDASAHIDTITAAINSTLSELAALDPSQYLTDQIGAVEAAKDAVQASVNGFQDSLSDMVSISDTIQSISSQLGELDRLLSGAASEALGPIAAFNEALSALLNTGVYVVHYSGALSSLGSEVGAVLPGTGIGTTEDITAPLLVTRSANTATTQALKDAFGID